MGAVPVCMVAAFGVPPGFDDVAGIAAGIADYGVELVGGDLSRADQLVISIAALGRADRPALRSGGNPGDLLVVTGVLGTQAASGYTAPVTPRIAEGRSLAKVASAMIDLSDGIASDAARLAEASDCAAVVELELLPRADAVSVELAAAGGEDFELLAAIPPSAVAPVPVTVVGRLEAGRGVRLIDAAMDPQSICAAGTTSREPDCGRRTRRLRWGLSTVVASRSTKIIGAQQVLAWVLIIGLGSFAFWPGSRPPQHATPSAWAWVITSG